MIINWDILKAFCFKSVKVYLIPPLYLWGCSTCSLNHTWNNIIYSLFSRSFRWCRGPSDIYDWNSYTLASSSACYKCCLISLVSTHLILLFLRKKNVLRENKWELKNFLIKMYTCIYTEIHTQRNTHKYTQTHTHITSIIKEKETKN